MIENILSWAIYRAVVDVDHDEAFTEAASRLRMVKPPPGWRPSIAGWS